MPNKSNPPVSVTLPLDCCVVWGFFFSMLNIFRCSVPNAIGSVMAQRYSDNYPCAGRKGVPAMASALLL